MNLEWQSIILDRLGKLIEDDHVISSLINGEPYKIEWRIVETCNDLDVIQHEDEIREYLSLRGQIEIEKHCCNDMKIAQLNGCIVHDESEPPRFEVCMGEYDWYTIKYCPFCSTQLLFEDDTFE